MHKARLETFTDGVVAILITIMVLELHVPEGTDWESFTHLGPTLFAYVLSFMYLGTYWNNHHHLFQVAKVVDARVMWANLHLLFWLSLLPFAAAWMGENGFAPVPTAVYSVVMLAAASAYFILSQALIRVKGQTAALQAVLGMDLKGMLSTAAAVAAIPIALVAPFVSMAIFIGMLIVWIVPDRRMERALKG